MSDRDRDRDRVSDYGLELPSVPMILESLRRYLDDDEVPVVWATACRQAGVDVTGTSLRADELLPLVEAIEQCGDLAAVCAKGLRIRVMSYLVLSRALAAPAPLGG